MKQSIALFSILFACFFTGCFEKNQTKETSKRPSSNQIEENQSDFLLAQEYYRNKKWAASLQQFQKIIDKEPQNYEAKFFSGLIFMHSKDLENAKKVFDSISLEDRESLTDSCLELKEISEISQKETLSIAKDYFSDCIEELKEKPQEQTVLDSQIPDERVLYLGKIYDEQMQKTNDESVRKRLEEEFVKKYGLNDDSLNYVTSRYLELLIEKQKSIDMSEKKQKIEVLLIDNGDLIVPYLKEKLPEFNIHEADSFDMGLLLLDNFAPDVIVFDWHVSENAKKNQKAIEEIRQEEKYEFVPILLFCGTSSLGIIDSSYLAGADSFLAKPATIKEFKDAIIKIVDQEKFSKELIKKLQNF